MTDKLDKSKAWFRDLIDPITSLPHAERVVADTVKGVYAIAAVFVGFVVLTQQIQLFIDPLIMAILARFISKGKSRSSSVLLLLYMLVCGIVTTLNCLDASRTPANGGHNLLLAVFMILCSASAVRATFAYHRIRRTIINVRHVVYLNIYALLFGLIGFALMSIIGYGTVVGSNEGQTLDDQRLTLLGNIGLSGILFAYTLVFMRKMPFTKSWPIEVLAGESPQDVPA